jgi:hypothetical protein
MGINVRTMDEPTEMAARVTAGNERRERAIREMVRRGDMSLDDYLVNVRGFQPHHLPNIRDRFHAAIFGVNGKAVSGV